MTRRQPLIWAALRFFTKLCGMMSHERAVALGGAVGRLVCAMSPSRASRARARASRILGVSGERAREIIRGSYSHFGMALAEFVRLPVMAPKIDSIVRVTGEEHIRRALELGRGAIMLSAHIGCWEYAAAVLARHGIPMSAIGAEQRDGRVTDAIASLRAGAGIKPVGKGMDLRAALSCLKRNEALAIMLDQDAKDAGILSPFLGVLASTPTGPIKMARKLGTPVLPAHITRDPDGKSMTFTIEPPLEGPGGAPFGEDVQHAADLCNEIISGWIRETPEQWMWMYPRWESTLNDR